MYSAKITDHLPNHNVSTFEKGSFLQMGSRRFWFWFTNTNSNKGDNGWMLQTPSKRGMSRWEGTQSFHTKPISASFIAPGPSPIESSWQIQQKGRGLKRLPVNGTPGQEFCRAVYMQAYED